MLNATRSTTFRLSQYFALTSSRCLHAANMSSEHRGDNFKKQRLMTPARPQESQDNKFNSFQNEASILVISDGSFGTCPSVLVSSDRARLLFNCGSGLQRLAFTNSVKLSKIQDVFLTNLSFKAVSGILGLSLTLQDMGTTKLQVHSNSSIKNLFDSAKSFISLHQETDCSAVPYSHGELDFTDDLRVKEIPILRIDGKTGKEDDKVIAYLCRLPDMPGTLDPKKCKELRVPVGPLLAKLKSGSDITLKDGTVVKSKDVVADTQKGPSILILECPTKHDIAAFIGCDLRTNQIDAKNIDSPIDQPIDLVIHMTPSDVYDDSEYQSFIDTFGQSCRHIFLNDKDSEQLPLADIYRTNYLLGKLDSVLFPSLFLPEYMKERISSEMQANKSPPKLESNPVKLSNFMADELRYVESREYKKTDRITKMSTLDRVLIRPRQRIDTADSRMNIDALYQEAVLDSAFEKTISQLRECQKTLVPPKSYEPEVVFLGTGSAIPSKLRNTTCILINCYHPEERSVILDCGEDSYGQLRRLYGEEKAGKILSQLKLIYISHHHTDHHIGLAEILYRRKQYTSEPLVLILPPGITESLDFNHKALGDLNDTFNLFSSKILRRQHQATQPIYSYTQREMRDDITRRLNGLIEDIATCSVNHCQNACGVVIKFKIGHKDLDTYTIAYSGDCRPTEDFIRIGEGCDLLIHEATFDHWNEKDAQLKKHSTTSEAIKVGHDMNSKFTILTHFSQRYPKIPYFTDEFDDKVGFAFDMLSVKCPSQLCRLPALKPILSLVYQESLSEIEFGRHKAEVRAQMIQKVLSQSP